MMNVNTNVYKYFYNQFYTRQNTHIYMPPYILLCKNLYKRPYMFLHIHYIPSFSLNLWHVK